MGTPRKKITTKYTYANKTVFNPKKTPMIILTIPKFQI